MRNGCNLLVGSHGLGWAGQGRGCAGERGLCVVSPRWDNGGVADAGAMTLGDGSSGTTVEPISAENIVLGTAASGMPSIVWDYGHIHSQLVVGRSADNLVTLFPYYRGYLPLVMRG